VRQGPIDCWATAKGLGLASRIGPAFPEISHFSTAAPLGVRGQGVRAGSPVGRSRRAGQGRAIMVVASREVWSAGFSRGRLH
jgi:hypothetical protein